MSIKQSIGLFPTPSLSFIFSITTSPPEREPLFKPDTHGAELVPELKVVSEYIFTKTKSNALTSEAFAAFIQENGITEFYIAGADAAACVKSTCFNMKKCGYTVHVLSDCITSYDKKKLPEMLAYYENKGCSVKKPDETIHP